MVTEALFHGRHRLPPQLAQHQRLRPVGLADHLVVPLDLRPPVWKGPVPWDSPAPSRATSAPRCVAESDSRQEPLFLSASSGRAAGPTRGCCVLQFCPAVSARLSPALLPLEEFQAFQARKPTSSPKRQTTKAHGKPPLQPRDERYLPAAVFSLLRVPGVSFQ